MEELCEALMKKLPAKQVYSLCNMLVHALKSKEQMMKTSYCKQTLINKKKEGQNGAYI